MLVTLAVVVVVPLTGWYVYANYFGRDARLYRAAVAELRRSAHDKNFEVTDWTGPGYYWCSTDETKMFRGCAVSFRSQPDGPLFGTKVTTWYFGITADEKLVAAWVDLKRGVMGIDDINSDKCMVPIPQHIAARGEKHPFVVAREKEFVK